MRPVAAQVATAKFPPTARLSQNKQPRAEEEGEKMKAKEGEKVKENGELHRCDLWEVHGKFYDLRAFVAQHPGGTRAISLGQGTDCTEMFEMYHPFTDKHKKTLNQFEVSVPFVPSESSFDWDRKPFYDEAKAAVRKYFSPRGDETSKEIQYNSKANWFAWLEEAVALPIVAYVFLQWCQGSKAAIVGFPIVYWLVCSRMMHNGSHYAQSLSPWINTAFHYVGSFHVQADLWNLQHVVGHHAHTNVIDKDPDLCHFLMKDEDQKAMPGYRCHQGHEALPKYERLWKFAMFILSATTTIGISFLLVPEYLSKGRIHTVPIPPRVVNSIKTDRLLLLTGVLSVLWFHGILQGLFAVFWSWAIHGFIFHMFSQMSHVNEECMMKGAEEYAQRVGNPKIEWAAHQMLSCHDYDCDSWLWGRLSIDLNKQIPHHLFPSVHPVHYPAMRHLMLPIARKHGLDYDRRSTCTFLDVIKLYLGHVNQINEKPAPSASAPMVSSSTKAALMGVTGFLGASLVLPMWHFGLLA